MIRTSTGVTGVLFILMSATQAHAQETDPFIWLEEVESPRALEWVETKNAATLAELTTHPAYEPIFEKTKQILDSRDRIAFPSILGDQLYNFWQDTQNPRGVWRRTSWGSYLSGEPEWETVPFRSPYNSGPVADMPRLPDYWTSIEVADADQPIRLATSPARGFV